MHPRTSNADWLLGRKRSLPALAGGQSTTNNKTTINKNDKTTMVKLTRSERSKTVVEQEAERDRKEDKEV